MKSVFGQGWPANVELNLRAEAGRTRLARCAHNGPLYVQKPFYPEGKDHPHLYLLHPPGGIVSGDSLNVSVDISAACGALITTPGATRVYRARENNPLQRQRVCLRLDAGAALEWFPLETIVFDGAWVELETTVELDRDSRFIGWELTCFGLPASQQRFNSGRFKQRYCVIREGEPVFTEVFCLDDDNRALMLDGPASLRGEPVTGIFLAGPYAVEKRVPLLQLLRETVTEQCVALSWLDDFLIGRYLGDSASNARKLYTAWWRCLRSPLLGRAACAPRIWFT